ncbi:MAG: 3-phosphoshikimate 1-carboxyvinyltransferase [Candidatus Omnitrophica bacterium]|nr:3-phosphoshikimate 1-carboxyvinyltransferase [Candidatus Omnitrophota bacterium]
MKGILIRPAHQGLRGIIHLPGDKSIAHRACIISAISPATVIIKNFPLNNDCLETVKALGKLGIVFKFKKSTRGIADLKVKGKGLFGLTQPKRPILIKESGTTFRLLAGILCAQKFKTVLKAGASLAKRPMLRITFPLRLMGARINGYLKKKKMNGRIVYEEYPPLSIAPARLSGITYKLPVASAQVKSALLLASLYASGSTKIIEPVKTRDHTERMLKAFQAHISCKKNSIRIKGGRPLIAPKELFIPGDISSASFFIVLGLLLKNSYLVLRSISLNPSRMGVIKVLRQMGGYVKIKKDSVHSTNEPMGNLIVKTSSLSACFINEREIPSLIDELPILMVAASLAKGKSIFKGVGELRVKETDRIKAMLYNLNKMGAQITLSSRKHSKAGEVEDIIIQGVDYLKGAKLKSFQDHRTAMSMIVAGLCAEGESYLDDVGCIAKSFPGFLEILRQFFPL